MNFLQPVFAALASLALLLGVPGLSSSTSSSRPAPAPTTTATSAPSTEPSSAPSTEPSSESSSEPSTKPAAPAPTPAADCSNCVALTYDDGPMPGTTDAILDIYASRGVKASFFMIGQNVAEHPELARRVKDEGHTVGNHSYNHLRLPEHPDKKIWNELFATNWEIQEQTGVEAKWMRPPYTDYDGRVTEASRDAGLSVTAWDVDTADWEHKNPERTCKTVLDQAKGGSIVVMHDVHKETVASTECIIDGLLAKGLVPVTLDQLVPNPTPGTVYRTRTDFDAFSN
ncbi:polysaccharide deacetylase family protein [Corynebacterium glaucum]|uniref:polysaccharide deacetylase family protein n=1 Tax=Corynebacterium glaucum TaxID=187491 RepID=UPI00265947ED|nr:polysaccharide deacetylase family protein [Corynebacterium glaucum]